VPPYSTGDPQCEYAEVAGEDLSAAE